MLAGNNFDTSRFAVAVEMDGMVQESFSFYDGSELFNPCKAMDPVIENIWRTKIFVSNIFMIHKVLPKFTKILTTEKLKPYSILVVYSHKFSEFCTIVAIPYSKFCLQGPISAKHQFLCPAIISAIIISAK